MPVAASGPVKASVPPTRIGCPCCAAAAPAHVAAIAIARTPKARRVTPSPILSSPDLFRCVCKGRVPDPPCLATASLLEIADEIVRNRRPPPVQRFVERIIPRLPRAVAGNAVNVAEILGEAVPRVAHVVKEVRA